MNGGVTIPDAVLSALESGINGYIALDPEGAARLEGLDGRVILIEIAGFGTRIYVVPGVNGVRLFSDYAREPDCVLRGSPLALARMGVADHKEDALFSGEVEIKGDTDLARAFGNFVGGLDVDWEEQLSRLVGDPAAHRIGLQVKALDEWRRRTAATLTADAVEYLQEEARLTPGPLEVQAYLEEVDRLRDDVERLAARIERLADAAAGIAGDTRKRSG